VIQSSHDWSYKATWVVETRDCCRVNAYNIPHLKLAQAYLQICNPFPILP